MVQVSIIIEDKTNLNELMPKILKRGMDLTSQDLLGELTKNSPVDHGVLKGWFIASKADTEVAIRTPAAYAQYVNDGTGIYNGGGLIMPSGKALKFKPGKKWNGPVNKEGFVFLKYSRGQPGQKFIEKSIDATRNRIEGHFQIAISEATS